LIGDALALSGVKEFNSIKDCELFCRLVTAPTQKAVLDALNRISRIRQPTQSDATLLWSGTEIKWRVNMDFIRATIG
jgi:hypothetical protein